MTNQDGNPVGESTIELVGVMHRLRTECPWHAQHDHASLVPYLVEECYELVEAIESGDRDAIREELGDLLYQVTFHSELLDESLAADAGLDAGGASSAGGGANADARSGGSRAETLDAGTSFAVVAARLSDKLRLRHPHVFGDAGPTTVEQLDATWEQVKQHSVGKRRAVLEGVPASLPALALAEKVLERASRHGRDDDVFERADAPEHPTTEAEFGSALLGLVADAKAHGVNAEHALRATLREVSASLAE
ncbi:MazG nucleotide pyrophosphohydrolase domain-containing protein [Lysinibacter cavernae]|uniref:XTP/dITP diphosphohydrolase n=2 Tax=Lysinibacter cavernae TaxID=1640652 RepID=A0A7X5QY90_9MICO|nr:MazG nucleotide pyrophosphohydrolase domain-containing protein [Lysinibacter cavernae]NIH52137.1 XTP/dITP diphosphohydrolase [Lysinibacter cavernae]